MYVVDPGLLNRRVRVLVAKTERDPATSSSYHIQKAECAEEE